MTSHIISLGVRLDRPMPKDTAMTLARTWAADANLTTGMCSYDADGRYEVQGMLRDPDVEARDDKTADLPGRLARTANLLAAVLAGHGFRVVYWDNVELLSSDTVDARLRAVSFPECVSTYEFAEMLGVTRQRVYQLESDRKAGRDTTGFPRPILDGYWLRSMAETYRDNRKSKPGPAPKASS